MVHLLLSITKKAIGMKFAFINLLLENNKFYKNIERSELF